MPALTTVDAVLWPALTEILAGTGNAVGLLLDKVTFAPPAGAGMASVTVSVALAPLPTVDGTVSVTGA